MEARLEMAALVARSQAAVEQAASAEQPE